MSWRRGLWVAVLVLQGLEVAGWIVLDQLRRHQVEAYRPIATTLSEAHRGAIERFIDGQGEVRFDAQLGWTSAEPMPAPLPSGGFVFAGGTATHRGAWVERVADGVVNLAAPGYSLDQALLRFERHREALAPRAVFIEVSGATFDGNGNHWPAFRRPNTTRPFAKPRFGLTESSLEVLPLPVKSLDDYRELLREPDRTLRRLGRQDLTFQARYPRSDFDFLATVRLLTIAAHQPSKEAHLLPLEVSLRVLRRFCRSAQAVGAEPVVVLFPSRGVDLDLVAAYLREVGFTSVDLRPVLAGASDQNQAIADALRRAAPL